MSDTAPTLRPGLSQLRSVALSSRHQQMLEQAAVGIGGPAAWRERKQIEAYELLALAQTSMRLSILQLDLSHDLRAVLAMKVTVPCLSRPDAELRIMPVATLVLRYPEEAVHLPQPGSSFAAILSPRDVWHGNIHSSEGEPQVICLGVSIFSPKISSLLLSIFGCLSFQNISVELDDRNSAGVMNPEAARWWQANAHRLPLSREPFYMEAA